MSTLEVGSVISGTCKTEDIVQAWIDVLFDHADTHETWAKLHAFWDLCNQHRDVLQDNPGKASYLVIPDLDDDDQESLTELMIDLFSLAEEWSPPYTYAGSHEGDGADSGIWPSWDSIAADSEFGGEILDFGREQMPKFATNGENLWKLSYELVW